MTRALLLASTLAVVCVASRAQAQDARDQEARSLFDAGQVAYQDGRFADAEEHFQRSYDLSHRTELLYNIGLAAEQARHDETALEAYRGFVAGVPESSRAARARNRISALEGRLAGQEEEPLTESPSAEDSGGDSVGGVILLAAGGAAAIAGAVLVGSATSDVSAVENAERGSSWASVSDAYGRSEALSIAGFVLLGVGVAAAVVGVVLMVSGDDERAASASLRLGPGTLSLEGTF